MLIGRLLRHATGRLAALRCDQRGNVLILTALSLLPLTIATGMVVDYSSAARLQTKLGTVADAAALAAITTPMMQQPTTVACGAARRMFANGIAGLRGLTLSTADNADLTISMTETYTLSGTVTVTCPTIDLSAFAIGPIPLSRSITVSYKGRSQNSFARLLGSDTVAVGGKSVATASTTPYIDIHLALDTSQSMGLAASEAGAADLFRQTKLRNGRGCQFGCHERDPRERYSMEQIARDAGIRLRVDVERDAALDMIDTARDMQGTARTYQFALYRIGVKTERLQPLTNDLTSARNSIASLDLGPNKGDEGFGDTNLPDLTDTVYPAITARGDGSSRANARSFLFIVTDGVTDLCGMGHCTAPIDPASCQRYKDARITVGVVYTTYLPVKEDPTNLANTNLEYNYLRLVQRHAASIGPNLKACASEGWFFEASDGDGIHAAMRKLFDQATRTATIVR